MNTNYTSDYTILTNYNVNLEIVWFYRFRRRQGMPPILAYMFAICDYNDYVDEMYELTAEQDNADCAYGETDWFE